MPRAKKPVKTLAELLQEASVLEENGGSWLAEHVAAVFGLSPKTIYRLPWLRAIRQRRGMTLVSWNPVLVRQAFAKQQTPQVRRELESLRKVS